MGCTSLIYRHVRGLPKTTMFSTRELLQYGTRGAVDQVLYRMVKTGFIFRLARGIFIRDASKAPSAKQIAQFKAETFGGTVFPHAEKVLNDLEIQSKPKREYFRFVVNRRSSSFQTYKGRVVLQGIGVRKAKLCEHDAGRVLYALWYLGDRICTKDIVASAINGFGRTDREELRRSSALMPAWLHHMCMYKYKGKMAA
jgi:hypothetical protein